MSDNVQGTLAGQRFGNYIAHEVLGRGGMGTVYLAEHPDIGRKVAVKVISNTDSEELVQRFLEEAKAVNRIGHPNIIDIYDFGRTESGRLYYVMEYLEGRELSAVMTEKRRMTPEDVLPYLQQLCAAMQAAHDNGIVHRDLKPANIFVLERHGSMLVKVLDFGVAKLLDRPPEGFRTMPGMMLGTPMFSAPEQAAAELKSICPQTDLYSIGVMVYWMLAGRPPFMADNNAVLMAMHMTDPPPPIRKRAPNVSEKVASLVEQCLAKKPADRPASARALSAAFTEAVSGLKTTGPIPVMAASAAAAPAAAGAPLAPPQSESDDYGEGGSGIVVFVPNTPVEDRAGPARDPAAQAEDVKAGDVGTMVGDAAQFSPIEVVDKEPAGPGSEMPTAFGKTAGRRAPKPQRGGAASSPDLDPEELPPLPDDSLDEDALEVTEVELMRDDILSLVESTADKPKDPSSKPAANAAKDPAADA
jgi:predicted Ser/Thr protein kinase